MRKVLNDKDAQQQKVFDENDIGKRFYLLKEQMNVQEEGRDLLANVSGLSAESHQVQPTDPAGPASGGHLKRK